ncbi:MAG: LytTR family transcriptional regulator DNA-binding domain-containing protein [Bacteroidota bacterium]
MNILIVEDEARIAKRIERMTREYFGTKLQSLSYNSSLQEAKHTIAHQPLDLVLLDLNLNGDHGFDLLETAVASSFHTIIISAYRDQALTAFEYGVLDVVPKPFNQERLAQAFTRGLKRENPTAEALKVLAVKKRGRIQLIPIEKLRYAKGAGAYTELFLTDGTKELHDKSLDALEQLLSQTFTRTHKSYLVKLSEIQEIMVQTGSKYWAKLTNGEQLPIGRTRYKALKERWG